MYPLLNYALRVIVTFLSPHPMCLWGPIISAHFGFLTSQIDSLKLNRLRRVGVSSVGGIKMIYGLLSCHIMRGASVAGWTRKSVR